MQERQNVSNTSRHQEVVVSLLNLPCSHFSYRENLKPSFWKIMIFSVVTLFSWRSDIIMHNIKMVGSLLGWTLQRILIISRNALNKNCTELNFQQKTQWKLSLSTPKVELGDSKKLSFLKYTRSKPSQAGHSGNGFTLETNIHKAYVACTLNAKLGRVRRDKTKLSELIVRCLFLHPIQRLISDIKNIRSPNFPNYL